jgi:hypothetical protein
VADDREALGRLVHEQRLAANAELDRPFVLAAWEDRTAGQRELDMAIGHAVANYALAENAATYGISCASCTAYLDRSVADHERAERAEAKLAEIGRQCARAAGVLRSGVPFSLRDVMVDARYILEITGSEDDGGEAFNRLASERNAIGQVIRCALSWAMAGEPLDPEAVRELLVGGILRPWAGLPEERSEEGTKP